MAITKLAEHAIEKGTYVITASFYDDTETLVTPNSGLTWTLTDVNGNVINSRSAVAITSASTVYVVLTNNDLALGTGTRNAIRCLLITGTYDSTRGSGLAIRDQVIFEIDNLVAVV